MDAGHGVEDEHSQVTSGFLRLVEVIHWALPTDTPRHGCRSGFKKKQKIKPRVFRFLKT